MNIQLDVVVAHYNNLHFIKLLDHMSRSHMKINPIIYNKSSHKLDTPFIVEQLENKGREGETYLHHIINNYDSLSEYTLFIQDDTNNHIPDVDYFITKTKETIQSGNPIYQYETTWNQNEKIVNRIIRNGYIYISTITDKYAIKKACVLLKIYVPSVYCTPTCAFFIVSKNNIHRRPKSFYIQLRNWLLENQEHGYILEHIWKLILDEGNTGITKKKEPFSLNIMINNMAASILIRFFRKYISNL